MFICQLQALDALTDDFVDKNLGFEAISREDVKNKYTSPLAKEIYLPDNDDNVILVCDGTYIYIQKSRDYVFSQRTFSMHKHRPLVKPMPLVTTTGKLYVLKLFAMKLHGNALDVDT